MNTVKYGEYIHGFGIINLNGLNDFENIVEEEFSTVVHEYIHFLQDTTTTFGHAYSSYIMLRLNSLRYNINTNFFDRIPINIDNIQNAFLKKEVMDIILGDINEWTYDSYNSIKIIDVGYKLDELGEEIFYKDILKDYDFVRVPQLKLELMKNNTTREEKFAFGAMTVMESMANLIELRLFPKIKKDLQIQYDLVEILCKKVIPTISDKKEFIVAICDAALMYDNPGLVLYITIVQMAREDYKPLNISEIYDYFYERNGPHYTVQYKTELDALKEAYENIFPHKDNEFGRINKYILSVLEKKEKIFSQRHEFIETLMLKEINESREYIISLMRKYHSPIYVINNKKIYSGEEINDFESSIIVAIKTLYSMLNYGVKGGCELIDLCEINDISNYNKENCKFPLKSCAKLLRDGKEINSCPLGFLLYKWNLSTNLSKFYDSK